MADQPITPLKTPNPEQLHTQTHIIELTPYKKLFHHTFIIENPPPGLQQHKTTPNIVDQTIISTINPAH
jgi:hypothetical protein